VVKRNHDRLSTVKITSFRNILKFQDAMPSLVRLLNAGGVWTVNCETAYAALVKCRVEKVCLQFFYYHPGIVLICL